MTLSSLPSPVHGPSAVFARIALESCSSLDLQKVLTTITGGLIESLDAALARIWLFGPADRCGVCVQATRCGQRDRCLHLKASAGIHSGLAGEYSRIPIGSLEIGRIGAGSGPFVTNDVLQDNRIPNKAWLREHGLVAFAGHPLVFQDKLVGVMGVFARRPLTEDEIFNLEYFANQAAIVINNAQLFAEVEELRSRLEEENAYLRDEISTAQGFTDLVGESAPFKQMLERVSRVADTSATVLIMGETGTGKELVARAIHRLSSRHSRVMATVNSAAISAGLVESELFGHERGAFTGAIQRRIGKFELANRGTIFLDEIGELPPATQAKLLRVLQQGECERVGSSVPIKVDVRVIAATHRNLQEMVEAGAFRQDLYYRLNVFPIVVPPLRERAGDIPIIASRFTARTSARLGKRITAIAPATMERLTRYTWPGNVRELENVLERAIILCSGPLLHVSEIFEADSARGAGASDSLEDVERRHIRSVLERCEWKVEGSWGAAEVLRVNPSTLRSRMRKLGIVRPH